MLSNNKTRIIAYSAVACALATVCSIAVAYTLWGALALAVVASVAVSLPTIISHRYLFYSILCYAVSAIFSFWLGLSGFTNLLPLFIFAMPFSIIKAYGESCKIIKPATDFDDAVTRPRINVVVRWVLYYILCELALGITILAMYLFTPSVLQELVANLYIWFIIVLVQPLVVAYNIVLRGAFVMTNRTVRRFFPTTD